MKESRISIVEFFSLYKKDEIRRYRPFPELLTAKKPALYRNFLYKEFHDNFFSKGLDNKQIDNSVVESFGVGGKTCITSRIYPTLAVFKDAHLYAFNNGTETITIENLDVWSMNSPLMN
ncbi:beta-fructofuranosidase, insoluble isoenzyme 2-like [Camellia sinensis]|uniref:beta-fructofuranosidase, insoluble isoenzyme 2-like n=1 Tax=Camellia sinensis TaxID=4442 RepID=UPI0010362B8D|nr:beta-fructofuranosidase, insoluble isoenzyme 2-like [Camellia sinensis]